MRLFLPRFFSLLFPIAFHSTTPSSGNSKDKGNSVIPGTTNQRLIDNAAGTRAKECYLNLWIIRKQLVLRESVPKADVVILPQRRRCDGTRGPGDGDIDEEWLRKMLFFSFSCWEKSEEEKQTNHYQSLNGMEKPVFSFISLLSSMRKWGFSF